MTGYLGGLVLFKDEPVVRAGLAVNFSIRDEGRVRRLGYGARILATFEGVREVLDRDCFFEVTEEEARVYFADSVPPAYALYERGVYLTPSFATFGPKCRAAMLVHESVHVVDPRSGEPAIHVSEWMEPAFSAQTVAQSIHNPSAYASFAAQVFEGRTDWPPEARYGAGQPMI